MEPEPIRIFLLTDAPFYRSLIARVFSCESDLKVMAAAGSLDEARTKLAAIPDGVDIAVIDLSFPERAAIEFLPEIQTYSPRCRVIGIDPDPLGRRRALAVAVGASTVVSTRSDLAEFLSAIRRAHAGETLIPPHEMLELVRQAATWRAAEQLVRKRLRTLTRREVEILHALAHGKSDKEIALELHVRDKTVATHVANVLEKLNLTSRLQAALLAVRFGFVDLDWV